MFSVAQETNSNSEIYLTHIVDLYLKRRNWTINDFNEKSENKRHLSLHDMVLNRVVELKSTTLDIIGYGSLNLDFSTSDDQYRKFIIFIDEDSCPELYKEQLAQFVFPFFVHFYLELSLNGKMRDAQCFWRRYAYTFWILDEFRDLVNQLKDLSSFNDIMKHPYFSLFRTKKYVINMSQDCAEYFIRYLSHLDHTIILQFLNLHFEINDINFSERGLLDDFSKTDSPLSDEKEIEDEGTDVEKSNLVIDLKNILKDVYKLQPLMPSIYTYSVKDINNLCCTDLSYDKRMLATGHCNSTIYLWEFLPKWSMLDYLEKDKDISSNKFQRTMRPLKGHSGTVYGLAFHPDNALLFSSSEDCTVKAWTMDNFEEAATYKGHHKLIWDVSVSCKGNYFATASRDMKSCLWVTERTFPLSVFIGHELEVNCVKFHPNCNYIATGSRDKTVRLWSTEKRNMVRMFPGHKGNVFALAFSPNGRYLASAGEDLQIKIWDLSTNKAVKTLDCDINIVRTLSFSTDGRFLAAAGMKDTVKFYYIEKLCNSETFESECKSFKLPSFHTNYSFIRLLRFYDKNLMVTVGLQQEEEGDDDLKDTKPSVSCVINN